MSKLFLFLFLLTPNPLLAKGPKLVVLAELLNQKCNPCQVKPKGRRPFILGYQMKRRESKYTFQLQLNQARFDLEVDRSVTERKVFPFFQHKFFKDSRFQVYGLLASTGAGSDYYHYFIREKNQFHYVGHLPFLVYDEELKLFLALEKDGPTSQPSFYRLKGVKFYREKTPKEVK